jgi:hypothetical protein
MPLLDHYRPPLSRTHPWRTFHIDVAMLHNFGADVSGRGAGGARPWSPGEPRLSPAVEWPAADGARVEVLTDDGDPRLAAAVELVSPRNKDRPKSREAFAARCPEHLARGCGVVVVDAVTTRHADMHAEILAMLEAAGAGAAPAGGPSAVSYRAPGGGSEGVLQAWPFALEVGQALPTVPLWLGGEIAVPLDLEASHSATCVDLRMRQGALRAASGEG